MLGVFRNKTKGHRFCVSKGSPYCDAKGLSQLISCLHDAILNRSQKIGENLKTSCVDSVPLEG